MASVSSSVCQEQVRAAEMLLFLPFVFTVSGGGGVLRKQRRRFCAIPNFFCPEQRSLSERWVARLRRAVGICWLTVRACHRVGEITHQPSHESAAR